MLAFWVLSIPVALQAEGRDDAYRLAVGEHRPSIDAVLRINRETDRLKLELGRRGLHLRPALERRLAELDGKRRRVALPLLESGLRDRVGLPLALGGDRDHLRAFVWLRELAGGMPPGLAVCGSCTVVFEPARKSHAWRCPACHGSPGRRVPLTQGDNEQDGYDVAGFRGELMLRTAICRGCGETFETRRRGAEVCSSRCAKRVARKSASRS